DHPLDLGLPAAGGSVSVTGDTTDLFDDLEAACTMHGDAATGHDEVYKFTTTQTMNLRLSLTSLTQGYAPTIYLATKSASSCAFDNQTCEYIPSYSTNVNVDRAALPAGTWYVVVDDLAGKAGQFRVDAELMPIVAGEDCLHPKALTLTSGAAQ